MGRQTDRQTDISWSGMGFRDEVGTLDSVARLAKMGASTSMKAER